MSDSVALTSRLLWPGNLGLLFAAVCVATVLDLASTFYVMQWTDKPVYEAGLLAGFLLDKGGWWLLAAKDALMPLGLALIALVLYRGGCKDKDYGLARLASVFLLQTYLWARLLPAINNVLIGLQ